MKVLPFPVKITSPIISVLLALPVLFPPVLTHIESRAESALAWALSNPRRLGVFAIGSSRLGTAPQWAHCPTDFHEPFDTPKPG
jgi:hypothetical protein